MVYKLQDLHQLCKRRVPLYLQNLLRWAYSLLNPFTSIVKLYIDNIKYLIYLIYDKKDQCYSFFPFFDFLWTWVLLLLRNSKKFGCTVTLRPAVYHSGRDMTLISLTLPYSRWIVTSRDVRSFEKHIKLC